MAEIKFSIHDREFPEKLAKEILTQCKKYLMAKYFKKVVYEKLENEIKFLLGKRIAGECVEIRITKTTSVEIKLYVAYNVISYTVCFYYARNGYVGDIIYKTQFPLKGCALSCNKDKFLRYNARYVKSILESLFPEFKFPNPDSYKDVYGEIGFIIFDNKETEQEYILSISRIIGDILYISNQLGFLFVTKNDNLFFAETYRNITKLGYNPFYENFSLSNSKLAKLISEITKTDYNFVLNNLGDKNIINNLVKGSIFHNL